MLAAYLPRYHRKPSDDLFKQRDLISGLAGLKNDIDVVYHMESGQGHRILKLKGMSKMASEWLIPDELVMNKIHLVRGKRIMLDSDLADLYNIETKRLKEGVRRNLNRFPGDFMFELSAEEHESLRTQIASSKAGRGGARYLPMAFTEQGVAMLSSVVNSETAIRVNIHIIRVFTKMREMLLTHKDILSKLEKVEQKLTGHDAEIALVFKYLKQLLHPPPTSRPAIGFKRKGDEG